MSNFEAYQFAETLLKETAKGSKLKHAYIATGGAMANENALKVCFHKLFQRHLEAGDPAKLVVRRLIDDLETSQHGDGADWRQPRGP